MFTPLNVHYDFNQFWGPQSFLGLRECMWMNTNHLDFIKFERLLLGSCVPCNSSKERFLEASRVDESQAMRCLCVEGMSRMVS
jgi:hypothetical protein